MPNLLITINTYTKKYTKIQINSIKKYCNFNKIFIVYNIGDDYDEQHLLQFNSDKIKIFINPKKINKQRHTGTLTQGIIENLIYIRKKIKFDILIILSERTIFFDKININIANKLIHKFKPNNSKQLKTYNHITSTKASNNTNDKWWWKHTKNYRVTNISFNKTGHVFGGAHEGIITNHIGFAKMCDFICLELTSEEREEIYSAQWCIEEYIIHTILNIVNALYTSTLHSIREKGIKKGEVLQPLLNHRKYTKKIFIDN
jgi:hypothetical protein